MPFGSIPTFIRITDGKVHDVNILDDLILEPGAIYVMDRRYLDFARLYTFTQNLSTFVTRAKSNFDYRRLYYRKVDKTTGLRCDQHGARGFRIPRPGGFEFYEFEAGSLGGRKGPAVSKPEWDTQFYGIESKYAFGEFTIDATIPGPEVTFRLIQDTGTVIHELKLTRSQLTPPV